MLWAGSNRGSFVLSAQVRHLEHCSQAHHKLAARLREAGSDNSEASNSLKGQQALINELDKFIKACES